MISHAVVFTGPRQVSYQEVICPEPGPGDVVMDLHHSWISNGTEGSFLRGERLSGDVAWKPGDPSPFPMIAGYQKVGRISRVGAAVAGLAPGDWAYAAMSRVTGTTLDELAGHVSPSVCRAESVIPLPPGVNPLAFSGLMLTQVGYNCGTRPPVGPGQLAVVLGDGLVGQWAGQTLARRGARVVMIGRHEDRLARFRPHGIALRGEAGRGATGLQALGPGPVHALVETTGDAGAIEAFRPLMARGGHVVVAGFYRRSGMIDLQEALQGFRNHELSFDLVSGGTRERLAETLNWVADGRLDTLGLITHRFPVEDAAKAWRLIETKGEPVLGVVLDWPASRTKP